MQNTNSIRRGCSFAIRPANIALLWQRSFVLLAVGLMASTVWAADDDGRRKRPGQPGGDFLKRLLEEFDADKNGRLDEAERAKAKAAMAQRQRAPQGFDRREIAKRFDKDGDGRLNEQERQAAMKAMRGAAGAGKRPGAGGPADRAEMMKRFDKNGDGKIDETERAAAKAAFAKRRGDSARPARPDSARPARPDSARPARPDSARPEGATRRGGEFLKRFDKDGDGKLSDAERAAARAAYESRQGANRRGATDAAPATKPDTGRVDKKQLLKEFDADGDGKLTGEERTAAIKAFEARKAKNAKN